LNDVEHVNLIVLVFGFRFWKVVIETLLRFLSLQHNFRSNNWFKILGHPTRKVFWMIGCHFNHKTTNLHLTLKTENNYWTQSQMFWKLNFWKHN
jgi:hypothetical protein